MGMVPALEAVLTLLTLVKNTHRDTTEALQTLLEVGKAIKGLVIYFRDEDGHEDAIFTGLYRASSAEALKASMVMSMHLTNVEEPRRGKP